MSIKNDAELANTQAKLEYLEARYESRRAQPSDDPKLRAASLRSLKSTINQFKEEIARYKAHRIGESGVSRSFAGKDSPVNNDDCSNAARPSAS